MDPLADQRERLPAMRARLNARQAELLAETAEEAAATYRPFGLTPINLERYHDGLDYSTALSRPSTSVVVVSGNDTTRLNCVRRGVAG